MEIDKFAEIIRSMNEHEDKLKDQRINLLISAQAILFAATSLMWDKNLLAVIVISGLGIFFAWAIRISLFNGEIAGDELRRIWGERKKEEIKGGGDECNWPPVFALEHAEPRDDVPCKYARKPGDKNLIIPNKFNFNKSIIIALTLAWFTIFLLASYDLLLSACRDSKCELIVEICEFCKNEGKIKE